MFLNFSKFVSKLKDSDSTAVISFFSFNIAACLVVSLLIITSASQFNVLTAVMPIIETKDLGLTLSCFTMAVKIAILLPIFGCLFAHIRSRNLLIAYNCVSITILIVQLTMMALLLITIKSDISEVLENEWTKAWKATNENKFVVYKIQSTLQCCGTISLNDYAIWLPSSCCGQTESTYCDLSNAFEIGCKSKISSAVIGAVKRFFIISYAISCFEVTFFSDTYVTTTNKEKKIII